MHISYIIHDSRMPKPKTAARMAQHLPLLPDERAEWLHYVDLYWDANMVIGRHLPAIIRDDFAGLVDDIWRTRFRAVTSADPIAARRLNLALIQLAARTLQYTVPPAHYLRYLNVMDVHQEVSATLGRRPDALWAARRMQWVAEVMTPDAPREEVDRALRLSCRCGGWQVDLGLHVAAFHLVTHSPGRAKAVKRR